MIRQIMVLSNTSHIVNWNTLILDFQGISFLICCSFGENVSDCESLMLISFANTPINFF